MLVGERYMLEQIMCCTLLYWELEMLYSTKREEKIKLIGWRTGPSTHTLLEITSPEAFQHGELYHTILLPSIKIV